MNGGAVAYLTHSPYGRNGNEIIINNSSSFITGNAGGSVSASSASGTTNVYNTTGGMLASTTGNITGIYDMSGGAYEYVAAWNKNSTSSYISNGSSFASQGGSSTKYATAYNGDSSDVPSSSRCIIGDATYEVYVSNYGAWFGDHSYCAYQSSPFFERGGYCGGGTRTGLFSSDNLNGSAGIYESFRVCLCGE